MADILTVHVVVVVMPVQRYQHLILQLPWQDLLLIAHLEGKRGPEALEGIQLRRPWVCAACQWGFQSSLINYHHNVLQRCEYEISSVRTLLLWLKSQVQWL